MGISIGIATIVTLGIITAGLKDMVASAISGGNVDFTVAQTGAADIVLSYISNEQLEKIKKTDGIDKAAGFVFGLTQIPGNPYFIIGGIKARDVEITSAEIIEGRNFEDGRDEVILGKITSKNLNKKVGDEIEFNQKKFKIVGIYESGITYQDGGSMAPVEISQDLLNLQGKVNMVLVKIKEGFKVEEVAQKVEDQFGGELVSVKDLEDLASIDQGMEIIDAATWAISLLAIIIGGIGVMNTIMMSVFERTREIGILRALGWKKRRVIALILSESFLIGIIAIIFGILVGLAVIWLIMQTKIVQSYLSPQYPLLVFEQAAAVGILVSLIGGLYPALRAANFSPLEALRYE